MDNPLFSRLNTLERIGAICQRAMTLFWLFQRIRSSFLNVFIHVPRLCLNQHESSSEVFSFFPCPGFFFISISTDFFVSVSEYPFPFPFNSSVPLKCSWHPPSGVGQRSHMTNPRGNVKGPKGNLWNPSPLALFAVSPPHVKIPLPLLIPFNASIKLRRTSQTQAWQKVYSVCQLEKKGLQQPTEILATLH